MEYLTPFYSLSLIVDQLKTHWDKGSTLVDNEEALIYKANENFLSRPYQLCALHETKHARRGCQIAALSKGYVANRGHWELLPHCLGW